MVLTEGTDEPSGEGALEISLCVCGVLKPSTCEFSGVPVCILTVCTETVSRSHSVVGSVVLLPPSESRLSIPAMCGGTLCGRKVFADAIEFMISRWGGYPVLSGGGGPSEKCKLQGKREAGDLTLDRRKERQCSRRGRVWSDAAVNQGIPVTTGGRESQGTDSPGDPPEGASWHLDLGPVSLMWVFWPPEMREITFLLV